LAPVATHPAPGGTANVLVRVLMYYGALTLGVLAGWLLLPDAAIEAIAAAMHTSGIAGGAAGTGLLGAPADGPAPTMAQMLIATTIAVSSAALLSLPVAWLYTLTRHKKGYRQSVVQTLVILPVVVAGVVVLVKHSLALAFSLAGIVAAVRFRNTLEDSKDAVYIFLATGIGLACGVRIEVAIVLSLAFNLLSLVLWYTEFGRSPAPLEGQRAERRMERALAMANRTGMFLARMDDEVLKAMSPEQLDALADRAWRRRKRYAEDGETVEPPRDQLLRVRTRDPDAVRAIAPDVLRDTTSRWRFGGVIHEPDGTHIVEFGIVLGEHRAAVLKESLQRAAGSAADDVDIR
jgi:hypothetical protein